MMNKEKLFSILEKGFDYLSAKAIFNNLSKLFNLEEKKELSEELLEKIKAYLQEEYPNVSNIIKKIDAIIHPAEKKETEKEKKEEVKPGDTPEVKKEEKEEKKEEPKKEEEKTAEKEEKKEEAEKKETKKETVKKKGKKKKEK